MPSTPRSPATGRQYLLIDTAGIRRKSRISLTMEKYSIVQALKAIDRADIALILLDAKEGISEQDVKIAGLALERGTACILVVNKWDLVEKDNSTIGTFVENIRYNAKFLEFAPIIFVSALSGQRVTNIFALVERVYAQYTRRVETGELNRKIREIIETNPPPGRQSRPHIFNYITQVAIKPPSFALFVRNPGDIHFSYERYLINRIRETFGFEEVPIRLFFRKKGESSGFGDPNKGDCLMDMTRPSFVSATVDGSPCRISDGRSVGIPVRRGGHQAGGGRGAQRRSRLVRPSDGQGRGDGRQGDQRQGGHPGQTGGAPRGG